MKLEQVSDVHQHSQTALRRMKPFVRSKKHSLVEDSLTQFLKRLMSLSKNALRKVYPILKKNGNVISMTRDTYLRKNSMHRSILLQRNPKAMKLSLFLQKSGTPWDNQVANIIIWCNILHLKVQGLRLKISNQLD